MLDETKRTKCMVFTRVMGYYRPIESFNIGKKGEHRERVYFEEKCARNLDERGESSVESCGCAESFRGDLGEANEG